MDEKNDKTISDELNLSKDGYLYLIKKVYSNKIEERELALDRYRKADEQMENIDQFFLIGKNTVAFLDLASRSSNELANLAKEIKSIVYKDDSPDKEIKLSLSDNWKEAVQKTIEENEKRKDKKDNQ